MIAIIDDKMIIYEIMLYTFIIAYIQLYSNYKLIL